MNYILCGEIASGKDEVAMMLKGTRIAFAEDLKNAARLLRLHDINGAYEFMEGLFGGYSNSPSNLRAKLHYFSALPTELGKDRRIYQELGQWGRSVNQNLWINSVKRKVANCSTPVIITDCRFHNELDAFPLFTSVYVEAWEDVRRERMVSRDGEVKEASLSNAAESEIASLKSYCDHIVYNNGTIEELQGAVKRMEESLEWFRTE